MDSVPHVFLSHASEDNDLALRLGRDLIAAGIDTFLDTWDIAAGDSLRQRIDAGLGGCTHFVVLITNASVAKPWVNAEIDAAFVQRVQGKCKLIPVLYHLSVSDLPPLLAALHAPSIDDYDSAVPTLIADLYGISKRPPLGSPPSFTKPLLPTETGLSTAARQLALLMLAKSEHGRWNDPRIEVALAAQETQLPIDVLADAAFELEELDLAVLHRHLGCGPPGFSDVGPTNRLFVVLDRFAMTWNPELDALLIANRIVSSTSGGVVVQVLAEELCWSTRRINPAVNFLVENHLVLPAESISHPYARQSLLKNDRTRRWIRENS